MMITSNRRQQKIPLSTVFFTILLIVILALAALWRAEASALFYKVFEPVLAMRNALSQTEVVKLKGDIAALEARVADRDLLYEENLDLKARLGRNAQLQTILAGVLMRPPWVPYDTFIVDAGANEGVRVGDFVSAGGTTLIGTVSDVYDSTARVLLYSAPGASYQGLIAEKSPISVEGQGGGSLRGQVPSNSEVRAGDRVVLTGIAGGFTSYVTHIEHAEGDSFQTVYMQVPVNLFSLLYVEIWKGQVTDN